MSPRCLFWTVLWVGGAGIAGCDAIDAIGKPEPAPPPPPVRQAAAPPTQTIEVVDEQPAAPQDPEPEPEPEPVTPPRQQIVVGFDAFVAGPQLVNRRPAMAFSAKYIVYKGDLSRPLKFVWEIRDGRNNVRRVPIELREGHGELQHVEPGVSPKAGPFSSRIVCAQEPEGEFEEICPWHTAAM